MVPKLKVDLRFFGVEKFNSTIMSDAEINELADKIKNAILKFISIIAVLIAILSVSALDSPTILPLITLWVSMGWLALFTIANTREVNNEY